VEEWETSVVSFRALPHSLARPLILRGAAVG
jgi:hypothetical protein